MAYTPLVLVVNSSPALCHLFVPPHPGQPTGELERQRRDLSFLKLALCGLVLPLRLRLSLQEGGTRDIDRTC